MPPRRKPTSTRQKKADQQLRRAIKRGDVPPPEQKKATHNRKRKRGPTGRIVSAPDNEAQIESARKLQSAFIKLPPTFLEETRNIASTLALNRPISYEQAIFHEFDHDGDPNIAPLSCPKRPKWRFEMSKLEVERNEEGYFKKWLNETDQILTDWQNQKEPTAPTSESGVPEQARSSTMPRSPSYFERNLEVWRQLWRVSEISQIILVLLDSRCPTLHYPPSLSSYLGDRKIILVLTKVDISGPARVQAWINYIHDKHPQARIVQVESYTEKGARAEQQGRALYEPSIPDHFRSQLVNVIKEVHAELLEPPEKVKSNSDRLKHWIPPVKREIDWESVMQAKGSKVGLAVGGAAVPRPQEDHHSNASEGSDHHQEPSYLTIGLIGQPNVGKSSLLNALFGARRVRASKTPGKTKHFQTLFWTSDVRLVDCPGLVMPNFVPMEMQILSGILPISKVSAVPSSIHFVSQKLPLERITNLVHPSTKIEPVEDKRTWREVRKSMNDVVASPAWTAMDILTAYADAKGWLTAKAGRPDIHRAGNALLRAVAEGRIGWAFWPPGTPLDEVTTWSGEGQGIWIPRDDGLEEKSDPESDEEERDADSVESEEGDENSEEEDEEDEEDDDDDDDESVESNDVNLKVGTGRFGALAISNYGEDDTNEAS
ncbi:P-loop containing nucleoside triphosphate hydrolase protein [Pholiota conissans]|uniref:Guanine nucleotide-binding protein-like 1 n=1 Tax=Pholiota conissans TaxID=109636 RepID=A0A9P5ZGP2_9AGAR|nr:P-loop containing nucleoside triphosphate hydrolase protein [Pholiota conissans]